MFSYILVLSIWMKTKHNSEGERPVVLSLLSALALWVWTSGKKCKESQGSNNLYLNAIVSFKHTTSFVVHCLSIPHQPTIFQFFFNWTRIKEKKIEKYPTLINLIQRTVYTNISVSQRYKISASHSFTLNKQTNTNFIEIWNKALQKQLHLILTYVYGTLDIDH